MITKQDVEAGIAKTGNPDIFHKLAFRHPDVRHRAGWQALLASDQPLDSPDPDPPEALRRSTPAGAKIGTDPAIAVKLVCDCCGGYVNQPPVEFLGEDQE